MMPSQWGVIAKDFNFYSGLHIKFCLLAETEWTVAIELEKSFTEH